MVSATWATTGSHSESLASAGSSGATASNWARASSVRPTCASTRARVTWSIDPAIGAVSSWGSMVSRPATSPSSACRHHCWVATSKVALRLPARAPVPPASARASRHSPNRPAASARIPRHSGTYQAYSGWRSASAAVW